MTVFELLFCACNTLQKKPWIIIFVSAISSAYAIFIMTHDLSYKILLLARCKKVTEKSVVSANFTLLGK
jgi:hypothetical protein